MAGPIWFRHRLPISVRHLVAVWLLHLCKSHCHTQLRSLIKNQTLILNYVSSFVQLEASYACLINWCWMGYNVSVHQSHPLFSSIMPCYFSSTHTDLLLDGRVLAIPNFRAVSVAEHRTIGAIISIISSSVKGVDIPLRIEKKKTSAITVKQLGTNSHFTPFATTISKSDRATIRYCFLVCKLPEINVIFLLISYVHSNFNVTLVCMEIQIRSRPFFLYAI